ncbi:MAG: lamin tail domain-containing protein, partial [bacterium]|nr:lamin tail domain-containing protein [bacterium]
MVLSAFFSARKLPCFSVLPLFLAFSTLVLIQAGFCLRSQADILINEIHSDPDDPTAHAEFLELVNTGSERVDLSGWQVQNAIRYTIPQATTIAAGDYLVIAQNVNTQRTKYQVPLSKVTGPFEGLLSAEGETIELLDASGRLIDRVEYQLGFPWPTVGDSIPEGTIGTSHSLQLTNPIFDNDLGGSWRSGSPTPGKQNAFFAANIPPQIRQVEHKPQSPRSGQAVTITAKVTDPDGVASVKLQYQLVDPGQYIHLEDTAYAKSWTTLPMTNDGQNGDEIAGDAIYTALLPATIQQHRRLVRYRIEVTDATGLALTVPYADDPQPNFAYFIYDGVPAWTGAVRPGVTPDVTFSPEVMNSVPVYHLISSKNQVEKCTWLDQRGDNEYYYRGTLVYDGIVYDHIWMRARGGVWRYAMGKNMWKFNFNRGHRLQARDNYGNPYKVKWDKLNLGACIQQGDYMHRGEQGMFESVGFRLFNLAGAASSHTHFVHFRIIDEPHEEGLLNQAHAQLTSSGTQYDGDFWGLYLATEQVDGRFLEEHGLPDGNLYKMEGGGGEIRNQSPEGVNNGSDLWDFMRGYYNRPGEEWWRQNVNLPYYYGYRTILEGIHHYDNGYGKNYYYYLNPKTQQWSQIAWDLDLTWADNMFGDGNEPFRANGLLNQPALNLEYQNECRSLISLLYNPDQTGQLIDEYASLIYTPGEPSFVDADRAMWDYHWVMADQAQRYGYKNSTSKSGQGRFYQMASTKDFAGMLKIMKDYVAKRITFLQQSALRDNRVPNTPTIVASPTEFAIDNLTFEAGEFRDPDGNSTFGAMQWRIAAVEPYAIPWDGSTSTPDPNTISLIDPFSTWRYVRGTAEPSTPSAAWRDPAFDDAHWASGGTPIGYGENFITTPLNDMRNNYTTAYLRKQFTVTDIEQLSNLTLQVLFDDGFNIWINGVLVAQDNVPSSEIPYNGVANSSREDQSYYGYPIQNIKAVLHDGINTIAVQALNHSISTSSDFFIDIILTAKKATTQPEPETPQPDYHIRRPRLYEINPVWLSEELPTFAKRITIPSMGLAAGNTYRVRVRMKDNTGRWSYWSDPVQFTAQASSNSQTIAQSLFLTELMYHPIDEAESEFVELWNSSKETLQLDGLTFTNGITYTFPQGTTLAPESYLLLVPFSTPEQIEAFRTRYRIFASIPILGPYSGKLSNAGERIVLKTSENGSTILDFTYGDGRGWPAAADGGGHSLVSLPDTLARHAEGALDYGRHWRASAVIGGSPGTADTAWPPSLILNEF